MARLLSIAVLALAPLACAGGSDDTAEASADEAATNTETGVEACAARPSFPEVYSSCAGAAHCGATDNTCASQTGRNPVSSWAFCTKSCIDDSDCEGVGDCTATAVCVAPGGGTGVCALDCDQGQQCPEGMMCLSDLDPNMPRDLCF